MITHACTCKRVEQEAPDVIVHDSSWPKPRVVRNGCPGHSPIVHVATTVAGVAARVGQVSAEGWRAQWVSVPESAVAVVNLYGPHNVRAIRARCTKNMGQVRDKRG